MFIVFERINHDQCVTLQMQYLLDLYIMQVFKNTFQAIPYLAQKTLTILNLHPQQLPPQLFIPRPTLQHLHYSQTINAKLPLIFQTIPFVGMVGMV